MIYSAELSAVVKDLITKAKLIDTGLLIDTVRVNWTQNNNQVRIIIIAQEYLKYHLDEIKFEKNFTSSEAFDRFVNTIFSPIIEKSLEDSVNKGIDFTFNPLITVDFQWL